MEALVVAVFVASLLGSGHCAGMCGPFVAMTGLHPGPRRRPSRWRLWIGPTTTWAYQGGRLVAYVTLGALAGLAGSALDGAADLVGVQQAATRLAGLGMIVWGGLALLRAGGWAGSRAPRAGNTPSWAARVLARARARLGRERARAPAAFALGAAASLMPCGWLYAFVVTASGTASAPWGAVTMAAFWLGSVPALHGVAVGVGLVGPRLRRRLPALGAALVLAVGLFTVLVRAPVVPVPRGAGAPTATCHRGGAPVSLNAPVGTEP